MSDLDQDNEEDIVFSMSTLWRMLRLLKPYTARLVISLGLMIIATVSILSAPYLTKLLIDYYVPQSNVTKIIQIGILYLIFIIIYGLCVRYRLLLMVGIGNKVIEQLRRDAYTHIQKQSFSYYDKMPASKIMVRVVYNTDQLQQILKHGIVGFLIDTFKILTIIGILMYLHFKLSLIVLAISPIIGIIVAIMRSSIHNRWQNVQKKNSNINAFLQENISGIKVSQAYNREESNISKMQEHMNIYKRIWMRAIYVNNSVFPIILILNIMVIIIVYSFGFQQLELGLISIGSLVSFVQYAWMFNEPIIAMSDYYSQLMQAISAAERIFDLLDHPIKIKDNEGARDLSRIKGSVEFRNVEFAYEPHKIILDNINFKVRSGEHVAIVGETGAGKTTIINLLTRYYDIQKGSILIDNKNIRNCSLQSLRKNVGVMMQESFLFNISIRENIRYGRLDASDKEIEEVAKKVHAHEFIIKQERGYETVIGERGVTLSIGQKQLLAFARILLYNPKILVLDEATSSIDTNTETLLQQAIEYILKNRTSFVIAHRLSTVRNADRIFVMSQGRLIEEGSHKDLISLKGPYYRLYMSHKIENG